MSDFLIEQLKKELAGATGVATDSVGRIERIADGIALVSGLDQARANEMVALYPASASANPENVTGDPIFGLALNLEEHQVGIVVLGDASGLQVGDIAKTTGRVLEIPVGEELLGHIVNPLGVALDGKSINAKTTAPVEQT
ncbi:MAG: hypothetical protein WDZ44_01100, partial [Candidatus Spechtbacterales bacterium]